MRLAQGNYPRGQLTSMSAHPLAERLPKFREMAAEARQSALRAKSPEMRREYEGLAQSWEQLIKEIEEAILGG